MDIQTVIILLLLGLAAGMLSGIVGIGGGIIIVPALVYFLGFSQKMAQGTSLAILLLPIGLLAVMKFYNAGYVNIKVTLVIAAAFVVGSYFGSLVALRISTEALRKIFACLLILVAAKMLWPQKAAAADKESAGPAKTDQYLSH